MRHSPLLDCATLAPDLTCAHAHAPARTRVLPTSPAPALELTREHAPKHPCCTAPARACAYPPLITSPACIHTRARALPLFVKPCATSVKTGVRFFSVKNHLHNFNRGQRHFFMLYYLQQFPPLKLPLLKSASIKLCYNMFLGR